jgi:hypothetical protein
MTIRHLESEFEVFLLFVVYLTTLLVKNKPDALFQCIYLFHFSICFEQPSAHHQENQLYQYIIWYVSLPGMPVLTGIPGSHLHRVIYNR